MAVRGQARWTRRGSASRRAACVERQCVCVLRTNGSASVTICMRIKCSKEKACGQAPIPSGSDDGGCRAPEGAFGRLPSMFWMTLVAVSTRHRSHLAPFATIATRRTRPFAGATFLADSVIRSDRTTGVAPTRVRAVIRPARASHGRSGSRSVAGRAMGSAARAMRGARQSDQRQSR